MKRVQKLVAMLLCAALLFAGCQTGTQAPEVGVTLDPKNPVAIEIWHYYNGPQKEALDRMVTEFNETVGLEEGIIVEAFSQGNVSELLQKVVDAANKKVGAGDIPDIFAAYADTAFAVDQMGLVAELDTYLTEEELSQYVAGFISEGMIGDHLKIFPVAKSTEVLMLNLTDWQVFADATGASLEALETMEGVTETAKAYYQWSGGKSFFGRDAVANYMIIGSRQLGVEIFAVEDGAVTLNLDKDVLKRLWDNFYIPYVNGWFGHYGNFRSDDMKTNDIIALVGSTSGAAYFPEQVTVDDTQSYPIEALVLPAPLFEGAQKYAVQQGAGMAVSKSTPEKEYASVVFLKWFTDAQRNMEFSIFSGYIPVKYEAINREMLEEVLDTSEATISDSLRGTLEVAFDIAESHTMYTTQAFRNGTPARSVVDSSIVEKAAADRALVLGMVAGGMAEEAAVETLDTDAQFELWYEELSRELEAAIA